MGKWQMVRSNLKKVDCCLIEGGQFVQPWRLLGVMSTLVYCWGWQMVLQEKQA
jgi:hypothetical protein